MKTNFDDITNKCSDCDNAYTYIPIGEGDIYQACRLDHKLINAYGCNRELLGNNAEPIPNYPIEDFDDDSELGGHCKNEPWGYVR